MIIYVLLLVCTLYKYKQLHYHLFYIYFNFRSNIFEAQLLRCTNAHKYFRFVFANVNFQLGLIVSIQKVPRLVNS